MRPLTCLAALALLALLPGCIPGIPGASALPFARPAAAPAVLPVAPGETLLRIALPGHGIRTHMKQVAGNGPVLTWMSADNFTLSTHEGVIVATRGFGSDLMAGDPAPVLAALADPSGEIYGRRMRYLTPDHQSTWIAAGCRMQPAPGGAPGLRRLNESCQAGSASFVNSYWLGPDGAIREARQWISAEVGYIETALVRN